MRGNFLQRLSPRFDDAVIENRKNDVYYVTLLDELGARLERLPPRLIYWITEDAGGDERKPYGFAFSTASSSDRLYAP